MNKKQKLGFDIVSALVGVLLMFSLIAAIHGHRWITAFESTPGSELVTIFSEDANAEKERMETARLLGALGTVALLSVGSVVSVKYYKLHDDPAWEAKKAIGIGVFGFILGATLYVFPSDLFLESIGIAELIFSTLAIAGGSAAIMYYE